MKCTLPHLDFLPGTTTCLHIPHGFSDEQTEIENHIIHEVKCQGKSLGICRWPTPRRGVLGWFRRDRTRKWLAKEAGISQEEADILIASMGEPVEATLAANPGTPRELLGITAMLVRKPDVLLYFTSFLDPLGCEKVHRYVASKGADLCVLHLSMPTVFGNGTPAPRHCPLVANCVEMLCN